MTAGWERKGLGLLLAAAPLLSGCGADPNTPPAAVMAARTEPAKKIPTTTDEKIQAIEHAGLPPDRVKQEIEKVKAGKL